MRRLRQSVILVELRDAVDLSGVLTYEAWLSKPGSRRSLARSWDSSAWPPRARSRPVGGLQKGRTTAFCFMLRYNGSVRFGTMRWRRGGGGAVWRAASAVAQPSRFKFNLT